MRTTTSINLRNNWHHAVHNFNQPAEQLASCGPQLQSTCGTIGIMRATTAINLQNNQNFYFNFYVDSLALGEIQLDFEFLMRFSDVLSQNTDPHWQCSIRVCLKLSMFNSLLKLTPSDCLLGFPMSSAKIRSPLNIHLLKNVVYVCLNLSILY